MDRRYTWVYLMLPLLNKVSCLEKVEGFTQGEVLLPCIYNDVAIKEVNIFWRDEDEKDVYNVLNGQANISSQFSLYANRASGFPQEYSKGNFSLLLKDLKVTDSGKYYCYIPEVGVLLQVDLTVRDNPNQKDQINLKGGSSVREQDLCLLLLLLLPLFQMLLPN